MYKNRYIWQALKVWKTLKFVEFSCKKCFTWHDDTYRRAQTHQWLREKNWKFLIINQNERQIFNWQRVSILATKGYKFMSDWFDIFKIFVVNLYPWIPADVPKARAFMQYNLAVCYATRGEFDKAMATLALASRQVWVKFFNNDG